MAAMIPMGIGVVSQFRLATSRARSRWILWRTQFRPKNPHFGRRPNTQPDLIPADCRHGDADSIADNNLFAYLATKTNIVLTPVGKSLWHNTIPC
jgi:hypothetical protein